MNWDWNLEFEFPFLKEKKRKEKRKQKRKGKTKQLKPPFIETQEMNHHPVQAFQSLDRIANSRSNNSRKKWMLAGTGFLLLTVLYLLTFTEQTKSFSTLKAPEGTVPFWTFTDVHLAADYVQGSDPRTFCTAGSGDTGKIGTFNCDVPRAQHSSGNKVSDAIPILDSALSYIANAPLPSDASKNRAAGFALFLGDSSTLYKEHPLGAETEEQIESNMEALAAKLEFKFGTRVFPTLGNHDRHPNTGCPLPTDPGYDDYLKMVARLWERWLEPRALKTVLKGGYYYADVFSGIRLISLNTMFFWTENNNLTEDIAGQLEWLEETLTSMEPSRKAIIFGHVPPFLNLVTKTPMWTTYSLKRYIDILNRHSGCVSAQIFGHMHADAFMDVGDGKYAMIAPGLTPRLSSKPPLSGQTNGKHPAFRAYLVDPKSGDIADYIQYWANLTEGNANGALSWKRSYSFVEEYGLKSESGVGKENFASISSRLSTSGETWCKFFRHAFVERFFSQGNTEKMRRFFICSIRHTTSPKNLGECLNSLELQGDTCQGWEVIDDQATNDKGNEGKRNEN